MMQNRLSISKRMRRVKSRGSLIEKEFARILRSDGIRYIDHPKIFGRPDFKIKGKKILIFCDSSFWHGRNTNEISGKAFHRRRKFWVEKLRYNKELDKRTNYILRKDGWIVLRFWDDVIIKKPHLIIEKINRYVEKLKNDKNFKRR